jgi:hypothetical protein
VASAHAAIQLDGLERSRYLDGLEATVMEVGWAAMRTLLVEQWWLMDQALARYRQEHPGVVRGDGHDDLKVVSRLGVISLPRQVCYQQEETAHHTLPGNTALPEHEGQVTTRGGQEWECLLPQDMPFGTAVRLLGWTHDAEAMSETQVRRWVGAHGQIIRAAEQAEVEALLQRTDLSGLQAQLAPVNEPRRPAAWPAELNQAVEVALARHRRRRRARDEAGARRRGAAHHRFGCARRGAPQGGRVPH